MSSSKSQFRVNGKFAVAPVVDLPTPIVSVQVEVDPNLPRATVKFAPKYGDAQGTNYTHTHTFATTDEMYAAIANIFAGTRKIAYMIAWKEGSNGPKHQWSPKNGWVLKSSGNIPDTLF
jgi:hypothetical protein